MKKSTSQIFTENLNRLMEMQDVKQSDICRYLNVSKATVSTWCRGEKFPRIDKVDMLARLFGVDRSALIGEATPEVTDDVVRLPVLSDVAAGYENNRIVMEDWEGESIEIPRSYLKGHPVKDYFMLRVQGDSMYPLYMAGDIVLVLKQATLNRSGDIGVIRYDGDQATLKKVEYVMGEDWMKLIPINPEYAPKTIENEDLELCEVLGIPRMVIREIKD